MSLDAREIGQRIRSVRRNKKVRQRELGDILGFSENYIGKLETGKRIPSLDALVRIADYFDVSLDYLVRGKE